VKLRTKEKFLEFGGVAEVVDMTIKQSAKGFKALMSELYSNPIESIIRELSSNAFDSHVSAGKKGVPFRVTLPSVFDQNFSIRDYGVGITHENMLGIYSSIFSSTKEEDNDVVGTWGLGSKSPFSYADSFSISCYDGIERRDYVSALGSSGEPKLICYPPVACGEERGVAITIAVRISDVDKFALAAQKVFRSFEVKPIGVELKPVDYLVKRGRIGIETTDDYNSLEVIQGCVSYHVESARIRAIAKRSWYGNLIMDVPIGTLDVTPSRESLVYTPETERTLARALDRAFEVIYEEAAKMLSEAKSKNRWLAMSLLNKFKCIGFPPDPELTIVLGQDVCIREAKFRGGSKLRVGRPFTTKLLAYTDAPIFIATSLGETTKSTIASIIAKETSFRDARVITHERLDDLAAVLSNFCVPFVRIEARKNPQKRPSSFKSGVLLGTRWKSNEPVPLDKLLKDNPKALIVFSSTKRFGVDSRTTLMSKLVDEQIIVTSKRNAKEIVGRKMLEEEATAAAEKIVEESWPIITTSVEANLIKMLRNFGIHRDFVKNRESSDYFHLATAILRLDQEIAVRNSLRMKKIREFISRYPMISLMRYVVNENEKKIMEDYMALIDRELQEVSG